MGTLMVCYCRIIIRNTTQSLFVQESSVKSKTRSEDFSLVTEVTRDLTVYDIYKFKLYFGGELFHT